MKVIGNGAEAKVFLDENKIIKDRFKKSYRHPELDFKLRLFRTNREKKILDKLQKLKFNSAKVLHIDKENCKLTLEYIEGEVLKDVFEKNFEIYSEVIGKQVAFLHNHNIIHGDLTTSNMILSKKKIYFIDFGLSFISTKLEDMAVDLHLLRRALESKHYKVFDESFEVVLNSYLKYAEKGSLVIKRLEDVELRGRNKNKF